MRPWRIQSRVSGKAIGSDGGGCKIGTAGVCANALGHSLAAAIFFESYAYARATAIIAIWTPDAIYIGADSRETAPDAAQIFTCKISIAGDVVVAHAGWERTLSPDGRSTIWDMDMIVRDEFGKPGAISTHIQNIEALSLNMITKKITDELRSVDGNIRMANISRYEMEMFFAYSEDGTMKGEYYINGFDNNTEKIGYRRVPCPGPECFPEIYFPLGQIDEIRRVTDSYPDSGADRLGRPDLLCDIIEKIADRLPDHVSRPVAVLKITPEGGRDWIYTGKCN
jgi:hypothetical protein